MIMERKWAMPDKRTFKIKPIKELLYQQFRTGIEVLDPFPFDYKKDATEFLNEIEDESYEYAVFDPPYSVRQLKECYKGEGEYDTKNSTWSKWKDLIACLIDTIFLGKTILPRREAEKIIIPMKDGGK